MGGFSLVSASRPAKTTASDDISSCEKCYQVESSLPNIQSISKSKIKQPGPTVGGIWWDGQFSRSLRPRVRHIQLRHVRLLEFHMTELLDGLPLIRESGVQSHDGFLSSGCEDRTKQVTNKQTPTFAERNREQTSNANCDLFLDSYNESAKKPREKRQLNFGSQILEKSLSQSKVSCE